MKIIRFLALQALCCATTLAQGPVVTLSANSVTFANQVIGSNIRCQVSLRLPLAAQIPLRVCAAATSLFCGFGPQTSLSSGESP